MQRFGIFLILFYGGIGNSFAGIIDVITGADMAGMEVTVTFDNNTTETATWITTSTDASVPNGEGFAGGAFGTGWSIQQQGFTQGNIAFAPPPPPVIPPTLLGLWTIENEAANPLTIVSMEINALVGDILFDLFLLTEHTPGSGFGRDFLPDPANPAIPVATYGDLYSSPDLWGSLSLDWSTVGGLAPGAGLRFFADTDTIPNPGTLLLLSAGLFGFLANQKGRRARALSQTIGAK